MLVKLVDQSSDEYGPVSRAVRFWHEFVDFMGDEAFDSDFTDIVIDREAYSIVIVDCSIGCSKANVDIVSSIFIEKSVIIARNMDSGGFDDWKTGVGEVGKHVYDRNKIQL